MFGSFARDFTPKPPLDRRRSLAAVPMISREITEERRVANDKLVLIAHFERRKTVFSRWLPETIEKRVELDDLGIFVYDLIDGERSVAGIIDLFIQNFKLNRREAELSVVQFLRSLAERRMIMIVVS